MTAATMREEALTRATSGGALTNYPAIYAGFMARGIAEADILPRVNVLTFQAWKALGRHVRKGEHGVAVCTWVPLKDKVDKDTGAVTPGGRRPKTAVVFHVSQTDPDATP
jgi:antirestriction protein ArdC